MKARALVSILILVLALLIMIVMPWSQGQSDDSDTNRPAGKVIFEIGQEDGSYSEFCQSGFRDQTEYSCRVGVDCLTESFPIRHYRAPINAYVDDGVEHIIIKFSLKQAYKNVLLRLARAGDETTVVTVDGKQMYSVTNVFLGSGDGYIVGVYNLQLGALEKGNHYIEMTVADDGMGNGRYSWDALALFAKKR